MRAGIARAAVGAGVSIVAALGLIGVLVAPAGGTAGATTPSGSPTASHAYSASMTYIETNHGFMRGATALGMKGHGQFSFQLTPLTAAQVSLLSVVTGVPLRRISRGGTYVVARQIAGDGTITGTAVATFKAHALGSVCITYSETPGVWVPGAPFVPMSGSLSIVGGTKLGADWRLRVDFAQTALTGWYLKHIQASGSGRVARGAAQPMSAACRRVAALAGRS